MHGLDEGNDHDQGWGRSKAHAANDHGHALDFDLDHGPGLNHDLDNDYYGEDEDDLSAAKDYSQSDIEISRLRYVLKSAPEAVPNEASR